MKPKTRRLLAILRKAILESLDSPDVVEAIATLEETGHRVLVSVDTDVDEIDTAPPEEQNPNVEFSPSDELFLRMLHIKP